MKKSFILSIEDILPYKYIPIREIIVYDYYMNTHDASKYLTAVLPKLKNYLLSSSLYSPITFGVAPHKKPMPNISIGNIYMAINCLINNDAKVTKEILLILNNWKIATEEKSNRELIARIRQWKQLMEEWNEEPLTTIARYTYEIRIRVIVQLLLSKNGNVTSNEIILILDEKLRTMTIKNEFIWENEIAKNFPIADYWYLYRTIN